MTILSIPIIRCHYIAIIQVKGGLFYINVPNGREEKNGDRLIRMRTNEGFTLIEILASIVILGILLTGFFQFFIFSQKTTTSNQDKLVALNIAQKVFEQVKNNAYPEVTVIDTTVPVEYPVTHDFVNVCSSGDADKLSGCKEIITSNNKTYDVKIVVSEKKEDLLLLFVKVQVFDASGYMKSNVKGYVKYEEKNDS